MHDKQLTTVSYAAGASLAAIALVYVFAPNYAIDEAGTSSTRKKGVVGLRNYANDCFINSTLQALAGLSDLRIYLIRETHRRNIADPSIYAHLVQPDNQTLPTWKLENLQQGIVTLGLKEMLDALNERPIYKKSTSAFGFVKCLETAFRQRISRQQQDAQEFLQIVAERLKDEYHAGERARQHANNHGLPAPAGEKDLVATSDDAAETESESKPVDGEAVQEKLEDLQDADRSGSGSNSEATSKTKVVIPSILTNGSTPSGIDAEAEEEEGQGFPMEGQRESQLQCQTCQYKTTPRKESFVMLTLNVPHVSSTSLSSCFDEIFKTEYIDDFKCEKCRLVHAAGEIKRQLTKTSLSAKEREQKESDLIKLHACIENDPENPPADVELPDSKLAPKCRIARSTRITVFPKVLAIHLSRSIFDTQASTKNSAKVQFLERMPIGGLADRKNYTLRGLVTHRGSHNSGHYESFRRQGKAHAPYPNKNTFMPAGIYSNTASPSSTPQLGAQSRADSPAASTPDLLDPDITGTAATNSSTPSLETTDSPLRARNSSRNLSLRKRLSPTSAPRDDTQSISSATTKDQQKDPETSSIRSVAASTRSALSKFSRSRDRGGSGSSGAGSPALQPDPSSGGSLPGSMGHPLSKPPSTPMAVPPAVKPKKKKKKAPDRWWRISDEKIKEAKTSEVLGMNREVYILFYELEK